MLRFELSIALAFCLLLILATQQAAGTDAAQRAQALDQALQAGQAIQARESARMQDAPTPQAPLGMRERQALEQASAGIERQNAENRNLLEALAAGRPLPPGLGALPDPRNAQAAAGARREHLAILVSSSMPEASMRRLLEQARRADALVVFRGLVHDDFEAMAKYLHDLLGLDKQRKLGTRIIIEPRLFERLGLDVAPVFALSADGFCRNLEACTPRPENTWLVAGDVSLGYALRQIARISPDAAQAAAPYIARLEERS